MHALIVEDDSSLGKALVSVLKKAGFHAKLCSTLAQAQLYLRAQQVDLVLLDLGLPDGDGLTLVQWLRSGDMAQERIELNTQTPIVIMTARDQVEDRVKGLDLGADDYLGKPFDVDELLARIRVALRRMAGRARPELVVGPLRLDPMARKVYLHQQLLDLRSREFEILWMLAQNAGDVVNRARLDAAVHEDGDKAESNTVEVHIHHLRKKLGEGWIANLRGQGYYLVVQE
ncbi:MAG: hypothetical protein RLZ63_259 [Pseudomonadota bacterium]|jgi:DNA-binding response OmpR family regulator